MFIVALVFGYREGELDAKGVAVYLGIVVACAIIFLVADWPLQWLFIPVVLLDFVLILTVFRVTNYRIR